MHAGAANVSNTVIETSAAGGLLRVRVRARALPATSAEALEAAAPAIDVLRRAPDAQAAAVDAVVQVWKHCWEFRYIHAHVHWNAAVVLDDFCFSRE